MEGANEEGKGWFATLLGQIPRVYERFIKIIKKYGLFWSLFSMALFIVFWSLIINPIRFNALIEDKLEQQWAKEREHGEAEKAEAEEMRFKANEIVSPLMEDIVSRFGVDRCLLLEMHNTTKNISGIDFLYFSATYEAINVADYTVDYISDNLQRQYVSNMFGGEVITMLRHKDYLEYSNLCEYKRDKRLLVKLHNLGCENVMLIPIRNANNQPTLVLCVGNKKEINYGEVYEYVKPFITQIQQVLIGG